MTQNAVTDLSWLLEIQGVGRLPGLHTRRRRSIRFASIARDDRPTGPYGDARHDLIGRVCGPSQEGGPPPSTTLTQQEKP